MVKVEKLGDTYKVVVDGTEKECCLESILLVRAILEDLHGDKRQAYIGLICNLLEEAILED